VADKRRKKKDCWEMLEKRKERVFTSPFKSEGTRAASKIGRGEGVKTQERGGK